MAGASIHSTVARPPYSCVSDGGQLITAGHEQRKKRQVGTAAVGHGLQEQGLIDQYARQAVTYSPLFEPRAVSNIPLLDGAGGGRAVPAGAPAILREGNGPVERRRGCWGMRRPTGAGGGGHRGRSVK